MRKRKPPSPPVPKRKARPVYSPEGAARKSATSKRVIASAIRRANGQFKPGVSGNPHGQPRKLTGTLAELIAAKVSPNRLALQLIKLSYQGDPRATDRIVTMLERMQRPTAPTDLDLSKLNTDELKTFEHLSRKARGESVPAESDYDQLMRLRLQVSRLEAKLGLDDEEPEPDEDDDDELRAVTAAIPPRASAPAPAPPVEVDDDDEEDENLNPENYIGLFAPAIIADELRKKREAKKPN